MFRLVSYRNGLEQLFVLGRAMYVVLKRVDLRHLRQKRATSYFGIGYLLGKGWSPVGGLSVLKAIVVRWVFFTLLDRKLYVVLRLFHSNWLDLSQSWQGIVHSRVPLVRNEPMLAQAELGLLTGGCDFLHFF